MKQSRGECHKRLLGGANGPEQGSLVLKEMRIYIRAYYLLGAGNHTTLARFLKATPPYKLNNVSKPTAQYLIPGGDEKFQKQPNINGSEKQ